MFTDNRDLHICWNNEYTKKSTIELNRFFFDFRATFGLLILSFSFLPGNPLSHSFFFFFFAILFLVFTISISIPLCLSTPSLIGQLTLSGRDNYLSESLCVWATVWEAI